MRLHGALLRDKGRPGLISAMGLCGRCEQLPACLTMTALGHRCGSLQLLIKLNSLRIVFQQLLRQPLSQCIAIQSLLWLAHRASSDLNFVVAQFLILAFNLGLHCFAGQAKLSVHMQAKLLQIALRRCLHLLCVNKQTALRVAQMKMQQGGVVGNPAIDSGLLLLRAGVSMLQRLAREYALRLIKHQDEHRLRVLRLPVIQQIDRLCISPAPQRLLHIGQHQIQGQALPDRCHLDLRKLIGNAYLLHRNSAMHLDQGFTDLRRHEPFTSGRIGLSHATIQKQLLHPIKARLRVSHDNNFVHSSSTNQKNQRPNTTFAPIAIWYMI
ncbi:hypothetical protein [Comamonas testosteroni]|uniref:hypothetical protein n=1 Tax=Comamonas testosteroni TaxID=285 RepID=UPI001E5F2E40|nr:hypothetical protein [Comamonas testosteroni]